MDISIYKLGDVGISSNLIGSPSLTNGQCPPPGRWIMKQSPAGVNSRFAEVTENDILRMQYIVIPNDTKKATKCFNTQFSYMSSVFSPDRQASLMPLEQRPLVYHEKRRPLVSHEKCLCAPTTNRPLSLKLAFLISLKTSDRGCSPCGRLGKQTS